MAASMAMFVEMITGLCFSVVALRVVSAPCGYDASRMTASTGLRLA